MNIKLLTILFAIASGVIGYVSFEFFNLFIPSFLLFGIGILMANHPFIRLSPKFLAYLVILPLSMVVFALGGVIFSGLGILLTGFISESISIYLGSGLSAVAMLYAFKLLLHNVNFSLRSAAIVFFLGVIALFLFFLLIDAPATNLYREIELDKKLHILVASWQSLVGIGMAMSLTNTITK